jgi:hypothetical protein
MDIVDRTAAEPLSGVTVHQTTEKPYRALPVIYGSGVSFAVKVHPTKETSA